MKRRLVVVLAALLIAAPVRAQSIGVPGSAPVAETEIERQVRALAAQLRCPVCQGLSLQDSPSELSQGMKDVIRSQLEEGKSPDEVKAYFVGRYGEWILLEPEPRGFNLAVYILPVLLLFGGGAFVFVTARRWASSAPAEETLPDDAPSLHSADR